MGDVAPMLNLVIGGWNLTPAALPYQFLFALPCGLLLAFCGHAYYHALPECIQDWFFASAYRVDGIRDAFSGLLEKQRYSISLRIIIVAIAEGLFLGCMGSLFTLFLIPKKSEPPADGLEFFIHLIMVLSLFIVPVSLLCVNKLMREFTNPILLLTKAVNSFSPETGAHGGGDAVDIRRLAINPRDEIGVLHKALVRMTDMVSDYIARREHEQQLEKEVVATNAASEAKSSFLSSMSHEIRTPINAVLGLDEMILREASEPEIRGYVRDIQSSGRSLLAIVSDILDFSKIEAGKMEIIPADYDPGAMVGDLVNMVASRAEAKGLLLTVDVAPDIPRRLHGDETRIKQCILNVLTNAVKYTPSGSVAMTISFAKKDDAHILLTARVVDTGIGIRAEDLQKLFSPFERIEEGRNRTIEGTGLGMSIVRSLLSAMGTRLEVRSVYDEGSDFSFTVEQSVADWEPLGDYTEAKARAASGASAYRERFQAPAARVLIVDDTPMNLTVMRGLLKATRIQIDTAEDGVRGMEKVRVADYDVIFIDHLMPRMDGMEMLAALKADSSCRNHDVPCVALTANAVSGAQERYLSTGFADYLAKPVDGAGDKAARR